MEDVTEDGLANLASNTQYFSTVLHGSEVDIEEFTVETAEIVEYIDEQRAAPAGTD